MASISFPIQLETALPDAQTFFIAPGSTEPEHCPGTVEDPKADEGDLCVYATVLINLALSNIQTPESVGGVRGAGKSGAIIWLSLEAEALALGFGSWAVTG